MKTPKRVLGALLITLMLMPWPVLAQSSTSPNYRVDQTFFGSGGEDNAVGGIYSSKQTLGELGVGRFGSPAYLALAGFNTSDDPFIEFTVNASSIDLGYLDTAATKYTSGTFQIRAWLAGGYVIRTGSDPPSNSTGYLLTNLTSPTASTTNTEQFGINLVANSSPSVGADPVQLPDNTFSFGQAASGYNTANQFKYVKGDTVASSNQSTSVTQYTVSYIFNITQFTPSGTYTFNHVLIATATY